MMGSHGSDLDEDLYEYRVGEPVLILCAHTLILWYMLL